MIKINLLPKEDRVKKREFHLPEMSTVYLVAGVAVFFAAIVIVGLMQQHKIRVLDSKIEVAKEESRKLAPQLAKIKQITILPSLSSQYVFLYRRDSEAEFVYHKSEHPVHVYATIFSFLLLSP